MKKRETTNKKEENLKNDLFLKSSAKELKRSLAET